MEERETLISVRAPDIWKGTRHLASFVEQEIFAKRERSCEYKFLFSYSYIKLVPTVNTVKGNQPGIFGGVLCKAGAELTSQSCDVASMIMLTPELRAKHCVVGQHHTNAGTGGAWLRFML